MVDCQMLRDVVLYKYRKFFRVGSVDDDCSFSLVL